MLHVRCCLEHDVCYTCLCLCILKCTYTVYFSKCILRVYNFSKITLLFSTNRKLEPIMISGRPITFQIKVLLYEYIHFVQVFVQFESIPDVPIWIIVYLLNHWRCRKVATFVLVCMLLFIFNNTAVIVLFL